MKWARKAREKMYTQACTRLKLAREARRGDAPSNPVGKIIGKSRFSHWPNPIFADRKITRVSRRFPDFKVGKSSGIPMFFRLSIKNVFLRILEVPGHRYVVEKTPTVHPTPPGIRQKFIYALFVIRKLSNLQKLTRAIYYEIWKNSVKNNLYESATYRDCKIYYYFSDHFNRYFCQQFFTSVICSSVK